MQEITGNADYLFKAWKLAAFVLENFAEDEGVFFYFTHRKQTDVILRKKELYDGAVPSGNSVMALNLHYLSIVFNESSLFERAGNMLNGIQETITKYPTSFGVWAMGLQLMVEGLNELALVGKKAMENLPGLLKEYIPNRVLQSAIGANAGFPLLEGKKDEENIKFYVCKNYACKHPVSTLAELKSLL